MVILEVVYGIEWIPHEPETAGSQSACLGGRPWELLWKWRCFIHSPSYVGDLYCRTNLYIVELNVQYRKLIEKSIWILLVLQVWAMSNDMPCEYRIGDPAWNVYRVVVGRTSTDFCTAAGKSWSRSSSWKKICWYYILFILENASIYVSIYLSICWSTYLPTYLPT